MFDKPCEENMLPRAATFILGDENGISSCNVEPKHKWNALTYVLN